ncbi:MAG: hypothetical protein U5Q44_05420 [Dehalococcoidia bacterium]|nr:hypothetical protein [Dehalococcoidia bacterium]
MLLREPPPRPEHVQDPIACALHPLRFGHGRVHLAEHAGDKRLDQVFLRTEVPVERANPHASPFGDVLDLCMHALFRNGFMRGLQQPLPVLSRIAS